MDPVSTSFMLKAGSAGASGLAGFGKAKAEKQAAEVNAFIGRTRAIQTDSDARKGLQEEIGNMRNVMAANQQIPGVGTFEMVKELRGARDRERRINVGNRNSEAAGYRMQGAAAGSRAMGALIGGGVQAGPSLFHLYQYRKNS